MLSELMFAESQIPVKISVLSILSYDELPFFERYMIVLNAAQSDHTNHFSCYLFLLKIMQFARLRNIF